MTVKKTSKTSKTKKSKYALTPEQKAEKQAARQALTERADALQKKVELFGLYNEESEDEEDDEIAAFFAMCARILANNGKPYSERNSFLIFQQCPEASELWTLNHWNELGYVVIAGSKSIEIFAPHQKPDLDAENVPTFSDEDEPAKKTGFHAVRLFDRSQVKLMEEKTSATDETAYDNELDYLTSSEIKETYNPAPAKKKAPQTAQQKIAASLLS